MDMADVRRKALRKLIAERFGGVARQMAIACKKPEWQINDMLSTPPRKSFGEKVARQIEQALGLPVGHLDVESDCLVSDQGHQHRVKQDHATYSCDPIAQVVAIMQSLQPNEQLEILGAARVIQAGVRRYHLDLETKLG